MGDAPQARVLMSGQPASLTAGGRSPGQRTPTHCSPFIGPSPASGFELAGGTVLAVRASARIWSRATRYPRLREHQALWLPEVRRGDARRRTTPRLSVAGFDRHRHFGIGQTKRSSLPTMFRPRSSNSRGSGASMPAPPGIVAMTLGQRSCTNRSACSFDCQTSTISKPASVARPT